MTPTRGWSAGESLAPSSIGSATAWASSSIELGRGAGLFTRATGSLDAWCPLVCRTTRVEPVRATLQVGETIAVVRRRGPIYTLQPFRIVAVADESRRYGVALECLSMRRRHEVGFVVDLGANGVVTLTATFVERDDHPPGEARARAFRLRATRLARRSLESCRLGVEQLPV
jgi:uncharacterized protein (UPF0548 family)